MLLIPSLFFRFLILLSSLSLFLYFFTFSPRFQQGWSALHWSADRDHFDFVKLLLERGIQINLKGNVSCSTTRLFAFTLILSSKQSCAFVF